jgi:hypothetical protein
MYVVQGMRCVCEEEGRLQIGQVARQKEFVGVFLLDFCCLRVCNKAVWNLSI